MAWHVRQVSIKTLCRVLALGFLFFFQISSSSLSFT
jgi:hypothetical protein